MKNAKRLASLMLALVMVFAMAISVSAEQTEIPANTGSILIQNNNTVNASEKTFQAYKILDLKAYANDAGEILTYEYTVPAGMEDFYAEYFGLDKNDPHFLSQLTGAIEKVAKKDLYTFARAAIEASNGVVTPVTGEAVANGYQFANLPLGYYAIEDVTGAGEVPVSAIVLTSGTPDVVIEVKASKPSIDKKIDDDNNLDTTEDRVESNDAAIGDTVTYVITSKVPENMDGYDKYFFIMNDQLDKSLTYGNDLQITLGGEVLTEGEDYILTTTQNENGTALKIVFVDFIQYENASGQPIEAVYTATLNEDAVLNPEANYNKVNLQYSNNPEVKYEGENEPDDEKDQDKDPLGETLDEIVETHTTGLQIIKTDMHGKRLTGAEFSITGETVNIVRLVKEVFVENAEGDYWKLKNGTYTLTDPNGTIDGLPVDQTEYEDLTTKYSKETVEEYEQKTGEQIAINAAVGSDGVLRFEGLPAGTYTIAETKAPVGYNMLTEELTVTIGWDSHNKDFTFGGHGVTETEDNIGSITVVNRSGNVMPETGGIGTTIFYVLGGVLLVAALVILISRKRMHAAN